MRDFSRQHGLLPNLSSKTVLAVGAGAGSDMLEKLCRAGLGQLIVIDPDVVEVVNLTRTIYTMQDIGSAKVDALARHIKSAAPDTVVTAVVGRLEDVLAAGPPEAWPRPDLLIGGSDSLLAQGFLNRMCLQLGVPAVFIDVHENAFGAMVVLVDPPQRTACYRCVASRRFESETAGVRVDLPGARGIVQDISLIDAVASKVALAVLAAGTSTAYGMLREVIGARTQIVVRTAPWYRWDGCDLFDLVLADLPEKPKDFKAELEQEAFLCADSLWIRTEPSPDCVDCATVYQGR